MKTEAQAVLQGSPLLRPLVVGDLDRVHQLELESYEFPWGWGNFIDSLSHGHLAWGLWPAEAALRGRFEPLPCLGYCIAMTGFEEMHLLNITVRQSQRGQGYARTMLAHLVAQSRLQKALVIWLEVRRSNAPARRLYERWGFVEAGVRKNYYPALDNQREDAIVMRYQLDDSAPGADHALE